MADLSIGPVEIALFIFLLIVIVLLILVIKKLNLRNEPKPAIEVKPDPVVGQQLVSISKQIGELKGMTSGVEQLSRVISNVKTRGIFGETQLGAIVEDILTRDQYEREFPVRPNSRARVEFAIKLPGRGKSKLPVYLPVDAKFPATQFANYLDARDYGSYEEAEAMGRQFDQAIRLAAKDICDKYIEPPYTTNFGIMFLPFESLYIEALERGLADMVQRDYKVCILGPTTIGAFLNSLQMGFQSIAIEKKAAEVWETLERARNEFEKYSSSIDNVKTRIRQANEELDKLAGVRTRAIVRSLRDLDDIKIEEED